MGIIKKIKLLFSVKKFAKVIKPMAVKVVEWVSKLPEVWKSLDNKQKVQILKALKSLAKQVAPDEYKEKLSDLLDKAIAHYEAAH